jgi:protein SCO1
MTSKWKNNFLYALLFLLSVGLSLRAYAHVPGSPQASSTARVVVNTSVPQFTLLNQDGKVFKSATLRGKLALVTFIYTTCPDICPLLTAKFAQLQRMLDQQGVKDFFLVSITTEPEVDTPKVLKAYSARYRADLSTWAFLSGGEEEIKPVWRSFGVTVRRKARGLVQHTTLTTLIDRQGIRRINYYGDSWLEKDVFRDMTSLPGSR